MLTRGFRFLVWWSNHSRTTPHGESGQKWGLRGSSQLWLGFVCHTRVPLLKPVAQVLVEDVGPDL